MTTGSFEHLGKQVMSLLQADDLTPLTELVSYPFTFIENDFTIVLADTDDLMRLHDAYKPALAEVAAYAISDTSVVPISSMLYLANFTVNVVFNNGQSLDPSKRVVLLGERPSGTKALAGMSLLECSSEWMKEHAPDKFEEVRAWAN